MYRYLCARIYIYIFYVYIEHIYYVYIIWSHTQKYIWIIGKSCFLIFWKHTNLHNGCTRLHYRQQGLRIPVSSHPEQHLFSLFLILVIVTGVRWNPKRNVASILIPLVTKNPEHLFNPWCPFVVLLLQTIYPIHWPIYWLTILEFNCCGYLYILDAKPLSEA